MTCNSQKCVGSAPSKSVVKFKNKFVRNCPDCNAILFQSFRKNKQVKDRVEPKANREANFGLRNNPKEYI